jgi:hypothetical protein
MLNKSNHKKMVIHQVNHPKCHKLLAEDGME